MQLLSRMSREAAHALYDFRGFQVAAQGYRLYLDQRDDQPLLWVVVSVGSGDPGVEYVGFVA